MQTTKKILVFLVAVIALTTITGCTNWKKKYESLNVEHQNLKGLLKRERAEKGQLAQELSKGQKKIQELQQKIEELNQTPEEATGFGEGYDVSLDAEKGTITVTLKNEILFAPGKANLKQATSKELDHIYSVLQSEYSNNKIDVVGHTDSDPIKKSDWDDNWELSAQRALSVLRYLVDKGISEERIRAVGCGASLPKAPNTTASGKAQNRRVEIVVHMTNK